MPNYDLGTAEGKIVIDTSGVDNAVNTANRQMGRLGKGVNAERVGRDLTTGVTLPIVAAGGYALKTAIDFETAFTGVTKTVDGTAEELARVRDGIIDMSTRIPATTTEIAAVAEAAGQLGISVGDIEEFTEVMLALGVSTNLTSDQAASTIARITNIMGTGVGDLQNFGSALVDLGNNSATTEADILEMANRIAGIANLSDSSEADMLSLAASLSSVGVRAEAGGTAVTKTIKDFDEWGQSIRTAEGDIDSLDTKAKTFYDLLGGTEADFAAFDALSGVEQFDVFVKKLQEAEGGGANLIDTLASLGLQEIRQSDSILRLVGAGDLLNETLGLGREAWEENSALSAEAGKRYETTASQLQIAQNKAENAARIFGEALLPILIDLLDGITPLLEGLALFAEMFAALPDPVRKAVVVFLALAAALGPMIFIGARIVRTVQAFIGVFKLLGLALSLNPIVLIIAAIAALVVGFVLLYKKSEKFRNFINGIGEKIQEVWGAVVDFFKKLPAIFSEIWDEVKEAFNTAKDAVVDAWGEVVEFFEGIGEAIANAFQTAVDGVQAFVTEAVEKVAGFFTRLPGVIAEGAGTALQAFTDFMSELPELIAYWLGFMIGRYIKWFIDLWALTIKYGVQIVTAVTEWLAEMVVKFVEFFIDAWAKWLQFLHDLVTTVAEKGAELVVGLITALAEFLIWLPGFLLECLTTVINWAGEMVAAAIQLGIDFIAGLIGVLVDLPGQVAGILWDIISGFPGFAADFFSGAWDIGTDFVDGLFSGIGDLAGLVRDMVLGAINGVGDLGTSAYNKLKSVGESMWNGFRDGLFGSPHTKVEYAVWDMTDNVDTAVTTLATQVRKMQQLSRSIPLTAQSDRFGAMAAIGPSSGAGGAGSGQGVGSGAGLTVQGPLVGQITTDASEADALEWSRRLADLTYTQLEAQGQRADRVNGSLS